jgi:hypothetical protein
MDVVEFMEGLIDNDFFEDEVLNDPSTYSIFLQGSDFVVQIPSILTCDIALLDAWVLAGSCLKDLFKDKVIQVPYRPVLIGTTMQYVASAYGAVEVLPSCEYLRVMW